MSVPSSVEELLGLIRKSGMIEDQALNAYLQRRELGRGLPSDPREATECMIRDGLITNFQAEQFLLGKWRGFTIGKFKLLERIGVGGMGQVFLCEHMFMKRRVAVKVLPPAKAEQPAALGRFYREARAAGSIEHANIVRTHDIDQDGNLHFIVMEYVDGTNLLDVVKKFGVMNIKRATHYIRQVALGLDFAFRGGLVHRDIKPGNILIDRKGHAKLLDMGLARFYKDQSDNLTVKYDDKIVLGTADYVAPEQVANSHSVDIRADIYALGASFYFLLAGHPPFPTGTVSQKLLWHRTKEPTPIRSIRPEVPEGLAAIIAKMMAKDPAKRQQTPVEVAQELEPWLTGNIPLPSPEEMPQLSPAAAEIAGTLVEEAEAPVGSSVAKVASQERVPVGVGNAAATFGAKSPNQLRKNEPFRPGQGGGGHPFGPPPQLNNAAPEHDIGDQETPRDLPKHSVPPSVFREVPFSTKDQPSALPNTKAFMVAAIVILTSLVLGLSAWFVLQ
jgi:eukaryotic-like serine/threonine-protein kinase